MTGYAANTTLNGININPDLSATCTNSIHLGSSSDTVTWNVHDSNLSDVSVPSMAYVNKITFKPDYCLIHNEKKPLEPEYITEHLKKNGFFTTVKWNDGTYTTVKASEGDSETRSSYMAFCAALAKKLYGSNAAVHRMVDRHMSDYLDAKKQQAKSERLEEEEKKLQAKHERDLLRCAKRLRLQEEAAAYNIAHRYDD